MRIIDNSVDLMVKERVHVVLNAITGAISLWGLKHDVPKPEFMEMLLKFDKITDQVVKAGQYQPKRLPLLYKVPKWSREREDDLADKAFLRNMADMTLDESLEFMGQVTGAWILACPEELIPEMEIYPNRTRAERFVALQKAFYRTIDELLSRLA